MIDLVGLIFVRFWRFSYNVSLDFFFFYFMPFKMPKQCEILHLDSGNISVKPLYFNVATIIGLMSEGNIIEVLVKVDRLRQMIVK